MVSELELSDGAIAEHMGDGAFVVLSKDEYGAAHSVFLGPDDLRAMFAPEIDSTSRPFRGLRFHSDDSNRRKIVAKVKVAPQMSLGDGLAVPMGGGVIHVYQKDENGVVHSVVLTVPDIEAMLDAERNGWPHTAPFVRRSGRRSSAPALAVM